MPESIRLEALLPATPERVYDAWLDSKQHSKFTGAKASIEPTLHGRHSAHNGFIDGINLELERPRRIVQTWRSNDFPSFTPDSRLEILLEPEGTATRLTLTHSDLPDGDGQRYREGWKDFYLEPLADYFSRPPTKARAKKSAPREGTTRARRKPAAAKKPARKRGVRRASKRRRG